MEKDTIKRKVRRKYVYRIQTIGKGTGDRTKNSSGGGVLQRNRHKYYKMRRGKNRSDKKYQTESESAEAGVRQGGIA